jgi:hypothetical protein
MWWIWFVWFIHLYLRGLMVDGNENGGKGVQKCQNDTDPN